MAPGAHFGRIGFVPAGNSNPKWPYDDHADAQIRVFNSVAPTTATLYPTPTLMSIRSEAGMYCGCGLYKSGSAHFTVPGRAFMGEYLLRLASAHNIGLVLCLGWNASLPELEYTLQKQFLTQLNQGQKKH